MKIERTDCFDCNAICVNMLNLNFELLWVHIEIQNLKGYFSSYYIPFRYATWLKTMEINLKIYSQINKYFDKKIKLFTGLFDRTNFRSYLKFFWNQSWSLLFNQTQSLKINVIIKGSNCCSWIIYLEDAI